MFWIGLKINQLSLFYGPRWKLQVPLMQMDHWQRVSQDHFPAERLMMCLKMTKNKSLILMIRVAFCHAFRPRAGVALCFKNNHRNWHIWISAWSLTHITQGNWISQQVARLRTKEEKEADWNYDANYPKAHLWLLKSFKGNTGFKSHSKTNKMSWKIGQRYCWGLICEKSGDTCPQVHFLFTFRVISSWNWRY